MNFHKTILEKFKKWRTNHISNNTFLIIVAVVAVVVSALAPIALKITVHYIQYALRVILENPSFNFLLFAFPLLGILLTVFYVQYFRKRKLGRGVGSILISIASHNYNYILPICRNGSIILKCSKLIVMFIL